MNRKRGPVPVVVRDEPPDGGWSEIGLPILFWVTLGPFMLAWSLLGVACAFKAARLLYDVMVSWGVA